MFELELAHPPPAPARLVLEWLSPFPGFHGCSAALQTLFRRIPVLEAGKVYLSRYSVHNACPSGNGSVTTILPTVFRVVLLVSLGGMAKRFIGGMSSYHPQC